MVKEELYLIDRMSDEIALHLLQSNIKIYKASRKIHLRGENCLFYAIRILNDSLEIDNEKLYTLFAKDDHFLKLDRMVADDKARMANDIMLLYSLKDHEGMLPGKTNHWKVNMPDKRGNIIEIDLDDSKIKHYRRYFSGDRAILFCERFTAIGISELLDCEL